MNPSPRAREIIDRVAAEHRLQVADLTGPRRTRPVVAARYQAMAEIRALRRDWGDAPAYSIPQIGRLFGGRDHTTVLYALRMAEARR